MKKLIFLFSVVLFGLAVSPIETSAQKFTLNAAGTDVLTNTATLQYNVTLSAGYAALRVNPVVTRTSGTAAGKFYVFVSDDGINYTLTGDSLTLSDQVVNKATFSYASKDIPYYIRFVFQSTGTTVLVPKVTYVIRKYSKE